MEDRFPDGSLREVKAKEIIRNIPAHTVFNDKAGGGGGYGDPFLRPIDKVLDDVRNELVSVRCAREDYGVAIDEKTMAVDVKATNFLRGDAA